MDTAGKAQIRERPLVEVKSEIVRRAGKMNPLNGIRAEDAAQVAAALTSLDRDEWAREWSQHGARCGAEADALAKSNGDPARLRELYLMGFNYYRIARYPCAGSPGQAEAYRNSLAMFHRAARYFDPPLEVVEVPFRDRKLTGYLQRPAGVKRPPVVMHWGGVDGYKEDRQAAHGLMLEAGLAGFAIDMPGTGENPVRYTDPDAERTFSVLIDYLNTRGDLDASRLGVWGGSYGAYWAAKLAHTEAKRLKGAVFQGGNVHLGYQEAWLRPALTERAAGTIFGPAGLFEARSKAMGVKTLEEFLAVAPRLSLLDQGLLDRPSAPLLGVNGKLDDMAPVEDIYLLMEHGSPKAARVYPKGIHMGRGGGVSDEDIWKMIVDWLKEQLTR